MAETLKHVADIVSERPNIDVSPQFDALWDVLSELRAKVDARLELTQDPSSERFASYGGETGPRGSLRAYTGPEVDWMVHSWVGNPELSFTNMHLTTWLGPHVDVPHLGYAFGTMPDIWFLVDFPPRRELVVNIDYLDRYYKPFNDRWLEIRERDDVSVFTSRSLEVRAALSPTAFLYLMPRTDESVDLIRDVSHFGLDLWLRWLDEAPPVPVAEREALAARDLAYRRNLVERDPANGVVERALGKEMADSLVRALWGGDRELARPQGTNA